MGMVLGTFWRGDEGYACKSHINKWYIFVYSVPFKLYMLGAQIIVTAKTETFFLVTNIMTKCYVCSDAL